jgi:hypothetical protein
VPHAVMGAVALAVHGAPRYSSDLDLLAVDPAILHPGFWKDAPVAPLEIRRGEPEDPIGGLVLFGAAPGSLPVDLVLGKGFAARQALSTALFNDLLQCPVVTPEGLALLKLEAGGIRDLQDLVALAQAQASLTSWSLVEAVAPQVARLSAHGRRSWDRLLALMEPAPDPGPMGHPTRRPRQA